MDLTRYQWQVLFAAWLGWGFDVFDGLLFNFVAPNCLPVLLGLAAGSAMAKHATLQWTGILTSLLLLGWAAGGIVFGRVADRIGRARTLMLTMAMYAVGTAACAAAGNIWELVLFRLVASLGIGGEWAAGAAMVAEVVPEKRRLEAGALLYTSAPLGLFLASWVTWQISGVALKNHPEVSWRYVFLAGLVPAAVAMFVRRAVREPERWQKSATAAAGRVRDLFAPEYRARTISGFTMAVTALIMWWSCNAFIPVVAAGLAARHAALLHLGKGAAQALIESWKAIATNCFNLGGLLGTLLTVPIARTLGRKWMFMIYFAASAVSLIAAFAFNVPPQARLYLYFPIGLSIFGVFGSFTYYLPELFPTRLRGIGAGFCYNVGRVFAAIGPFVVGAVAAQGVNALDSALHVLAWVAVVPLLGILAMPLVVETRGRVLED
ncbi:MAG: MFS transporter [Armatimonadetes bacterium]|nr:MFS transporter [Armatimonadota bacterium]MDE2206321.1 MFS transporter [Armatimonadota bacterium]